MSQETVNVHENAEFAVFGFIRRIENIVSIFQPIPMDIKHLITNWCLIDFHLRQKAIEVGDAAVIYVFKHRRKESLTEKLLHCVESVCEKCQDPKSNALIMICPKCNNVYHTKCLIKSESLCTNKIYICGMWIGYDWRRWKTIKCDQSFVTSMVTSEESKDRLIAVPIDDVPENNNDNDGVSHEITKESANEVVNSDEYQQSAILLYPEQLLTNSMVHADDIDIETVDIEQLRDIGSHHERDVQLNEISHLENDLNKTPKKRAVCCNGISVDHRNEFIVYGYIRKALQYIKLSHNIPSPIYGLIICFYSDSQMRELIARVTVDAMDYVWSHRRQESLTEKLLLELRTIESVSLFYTESSDKSTEDKEDEEHDSDERFCIMSRLNMMKKKDELTVYGFIQRIERSVILWYAAPDTVKQLILNWYSDVELIRITKRMADEAAMYVRRHRRKESLVEKLLFRWDDINIPFSYYNKYNYPLRYERDVHRNQDYSDDNNSADSVSTENSEIILVD